MLASGWAGWQPSTDGPSTRRPRTRTRPGLSAVVRDAVAAGFAAERRRIAAASAAERIAASIGRDRTRLVAALDAEVHQKSGTGGDTLMAGCGCGGNRETTVWLVEYEDGSGRATTQHATKTDAEVADARNGGGGTIRPVSRT